ncbi:MAG: heme o synthase [Pseudomonadota bacterium]
MNATTVGPDRPLSGVRLVFGLFKLRIGVVIALTALAGVAIQPGAGPSALQSVALFCAVLLASAAAGAFNQYYEVDLDAKMRRTRARPFVVGRLVHHRGWLVLIALLVALGVAAAWAAGNGWSALFTFLGAFFYAIVYTVWLKRRTWWNIVIGGLAGSFAVLAGASAVAPGLSPQALLLALILFLWTPPHFWSLAIVCRDDYAAAGVPMLPVVKGDAVAARAILAHTVALVALSLVLARLAGGTLTLALAAAGGAWFVHAAWRLVRAPSRATARRSFHASLAQLSLLLIGVLLDAGL